MGERTVQDLAAVCKEKAERGVGEYGIAALVILIGLASFGLGRLSEPEETRPPVSIRQASASAIPRAMSLGGQFVASWSGGVYYYPWCSGAQKIAPESQRWFESEKSAQAAGLRPAKNCKGLSPQETAVE